MISSRSADLHESKATAARAGRIGAKNASNSPEDGDSLGLRPWRGLIRLPSRIELRSAPLVSYRSGIIEAIGNTPLIKLKRASEETGCLILGKAEFMNPGQSVKDRAALFIIRDALNTG